MSIGFPERTSPLSQLPKPELGITGSLQPGQVGLPLGSALSGELPQGLLPLPSSLTLEQERLLLFLENLGLIEIRPLFTAFTDSLSVARESLERLLSGIPGGNPFRTGNDRNYLFSEYVNQPQPLHALLDPKLGLALAASDRAAPKLNVGDVSGFSGTAVMADKLSQAVGELGRSGSPITSSDSVQNNVSPYAVPTAQNSPAQSSRREAAAPRTLRRSPPRPVSYRRRPTARQQSANPFSRLGRALLNLLAVFRRR